GTPWSRPLRGVVRGGRQQRLATPLLEHQVGVDERHLGSRGQYVEDEPLQVTDVDGGDVDDIVVGAGEVVKHPGFRLRQDMLDERGRELPVMWLDAYREQRFERSAQRGGVD